MMSSHVLTRFKILWISTVFGVAVVFGKLQEEVTCKVKVNDDLWFDYCSFLSMESDCPFEKIPRYLRRLVANPEKLQLPPVTNLVIQDYVVVHENVYVSIRWTLNAIEKKNLTLHGFFLKIQYETVKSDVLTKYIIVEYKTKKLQKFSFELNYVLLPTSTNNSKVSITMWSLIQTNNSIIRFNESSEQNICQTYTELYEDVRHSVALEKSTDVKLKSKSLKRAAVYYELDDPCNCWRNDDLNVNINDSSADVVVTSWNFCPEKSNVFVFLDNTHLRNSSSNYMGQHITDTCCIKFPHIVDGSYTIKVVYACNYDAPTCTFQRDINITRNNSMMLQYMDQSDKKISILTFVIVTVIVIFSFCITIILVILYRRKRVNSNDDIELTPLVNGIVMLISFNKESSHKDIRATQMLEHMLTKLGVQIISTNTLFSQVFGSNNIITSKNLKPRLAEEVSKIRHFLIIATKDLYESYEYNGRVITLAPTIRNTEHNRLHYLLAEQIIKRINRDQEHFKGRCHFVALDETSISYCKKIYSFVKPTTSSSQKYCLIKHLKFNFKHFKLLLNSLPSTLNSTVEDKIKNIDTSTFLQIVDNRNNVTKPAEPSYRFSILPRNFDTNNSHVMEQNCIRTSRQDLNYTTNETSGDCIFKNIHSTNNHQTKETSEKNIISSLSEQTSVKQAFIMRNKEHTRPKQANVLLTLTDDRTSLKQVKARLTDDQTELKQANVRFNYDQTGLKQANATLTEEQTSQKHDNKTPLTEGQTGFIHVNIMPSEDETCLKQAVITGAMEHTDVKVVKACDRETVSDLNAQVIRQCSSDTVVARSSSKTSVDNINLCFCNETKVKECISHQSSMNLQHSLLEACPGLINITVNNPSTSNTGETEPSLSYLRETTTKKLDNETITASPNCLEHNIQTANQRLPGISYHECPIWQPFKNEKLATLTNEKKSTDILVKETCL